MMEQTLSKQENVEQLEAKAGCPALPCSVSLVLDSVICGDNCETLAAMPAESVDMVMTSPPYDDLRTYGGHSWDFYGVAWLLKRVLKPGGVIVWNVADATKDGNESGTSMRQALHFQSLGLNLHDTMIYQATGTGAKGSNLAYWQEWEYMFVLSKGRPKAVNRLTFPKINQGGGERGGVAQKGEIRKRPQNEESIRSNVWRMAGDGENLHPAPFPLKMAKDHIHTWSNPGDVVLDPFAGSGTTLKAAKELNRHFIGIEINPEYVAICKERISQDVLQLFIPQNKQI
jgi:DNA modification methylase